MAQQAQRGLLLSSRATKAYCVQQTPVSSKFGVYLLSSKGSRCCACWLPEQEVLLCLSTTGPSCGGFFGHIHTLYSCESRHWDTRGQGTAGGALHHHANTHGLEERNLQSPWAETEVETLSTSRVCPAGALTQAPLWGGDLASNLGCRGA